MLYNIYIYINNYIYISTYIYISSHKRKPLHQNHYRGHVEKNVEGTSSIPRRKILIWKHLPQSAILSIWSLQYILYILYNCYLWLDYSYIQTTNKCKSDIVNSLARVPIKIIHVHHDLWKMLMFITLVWND